MAERPSSPWRRYGLAALVILLGTPGGAAVARADQLALFLRHGTLSSDIPIPNGSPTRLLGAVHREPEGARRPCCAGRPHDPGPIRVQRSPHRRDPRGTAR